MPYLMIAWHIFYILLWHSFYYLHWLSQFIILLIDNSFLLQFRCFEMNNAIANTVKPSLTHYRRIGTLAFIVVPLILLAVYAIVHMLK